MIRFKVIRASRLLLGFAIAVLVAVLALLGVKLMSRQSTQPVSPTANLVDASLEEGARTEVVFASSDHLTQKPFDPQDEDIDIEILSTPTARPQPSQRILIYHTHTHEAYEQVADDPYEAIETWRTADAGHSVVRVGEELAASLRLYGFDVVHDVTDHEGSELSTAYTRSLETLMSYTEPFDLYIDLHRDAYVEGDIKSVVAENGESFAPLMLLIGNGNGFDVKPYYEQNYAFAQALEERVNAILPGLCKPVLVKDGRYNQNIGVFSVFVEVGHNRNTLREALNSVSPLASAIHSLMSTDPEPTLQAMKRAYDKRADDRQALTDRRKGHD